MSEEPASTFNKVLRPLATGEFSICAIVLGVTECLNGEVVPQPGLFMKPSGSAS